MKYASNLLLACLALSGCDGESPSTAATPRPAAAAPAPPPAAPATLKQARAGFRTALLAPAGSREPIPVAPPALFRTVGYEAPPGRLAAFVTPDPGDGKRHPAIVWITGGDCNSIGDVWSAAPANNDQTAAAYRQAGLVMLFPSLRGGNENPGRREGFLGEIDDVLAAADYLATLAYVDPARIYLGGHSTGGTLALLVAEQSDRFRAVFSFGPVDEIAGYGRDFLPFDLRQPQELALRSPGRWLSSIGSPTFVFEGMDRGNVRPFHAMNLASRNPQLHFVAVDGADHFSVLAPMNRLIARRIIEDTGPDTILAFPEDAVREALR